MPVVRRLIPLVLLVAVATACGSGSGSGSAAESPPTEAPSAAPTTTRATESTSPATTMRDGCDAVDGFDTIDRQDLPDEAIDTLDLIAQGGPFPFDQDGAVFQNRERLLPREPRGYYHEYTVVTPGSDDRGARRIVTGECDETFYTDDHYDSFRLIEEG